MKMTEERNAVIDQWMYEAALEVSLWNDPKPDEGLPPRVKSYSAAGILAQWARGLIQEPLSDTEEHDEQLKIYNELNDIRNANKEFLYKFAVLDFDELRWTNSLIRFSEEGSTYKHPQAAAVALLFGLDNADLVAFALEESGLKGAEKLRKEVDKCTDLLLSSFKSFAISKSLIKSIIESFNEFYLAQNSLLKRTTDKWYRLHALLCQLGECSEKNTEENSTTAK